MEPDRKYGYGYLGATSRALNGYSPLRPFAKVKVAIGAHIFYTDLLDEFIDHFDRIPCDFDLFITTSDANPEGIRSTLQKHLGSKVGKLAVITVDNVGRDVGAFLLHFLPISQSYNACCWVQSKKTPYIPAFGLWRNYLLENLLGSTDSIAAILEAFDTDDQLGVVYPRPFPPIADRIEWGSNFATVNMLLGRLGFSVSESDQPQYPSGSMFWFRPAALKSLLDLGLTIEDFVSMWDGPRDPGTGAVVDGTLSHALERMILYISRYAGYSDREILFKPFIGR